MDEYWEMCSPIIGDAHKSAHIQVDATLQSSQSAPFGIVAYLYYLEPNNKIGLLTPKSAVVHE